MFNNEIPEHAKIALEGAREDFLKSLRGRSEEYDAIRAAASRFLAAAEAPDYVRPMLEGLLILQLRAPQGQARQDAQRAVDSAVRAERARIRLGMADLLKE